MWSLPALAYDQLLEQKRNLVRRIPQVAPFFVEIYSSQLEKSIPFLPIRCFRQFELYAPSGNEPVAATFLSSGSTGQQPAKHLFSASGLAQYAAHSSAGFLDCLQRQGLGKGTPVVSLVPTPSFWPTSSLAAMLQMFGQQGFAISWAHPDNLQTDLLGILRTFPAGQPLVIFGTTFHHVTLALSTEASLRTQIQDLLRRHPLWIIDTGGTKGRTQAFTLEESLSLMAGFYTGASCTILSEYGMCELGSQAWSSSTAAQRLFRTNQTLVPVSVCLNQRVVLAPGENGFLGFIDAVNRDSWCAILTEDCGYTIDKQTFFLAGRSPDASLKGCSLHVPAAFSFESSPVEASVSTPAILGVADGALVAKKLPICLDELAAHLRGSPLWPSWCVEDLVLCLGSLEKALPYSAQYTGQNILIIAAANTPLSWIFPYCVAAYSGARQITLKIPSLRLEDAYAGLVRQQIEHFASLLSAYFPRTVTTFAKSASLSQQFGSYDMVIAFGTQQTMQTISAQIPVGVQLLVYGDVKNAKVLDSPGDTPLAMARLCSLWQGRGCLTPVALFCPEDDPSLIAPWVNAFAAELAAAFEQRFATSEAYCPRPHFRHRIHRHSALHVCGQLACVGLNAQHHVALQALTCVVNLCGVGLEHAAMLAPALDWGMGGCGFVYVLPRSWYPMVSGLESREVLPAVQDSPYC